MTANGSATDPNVIGVARSDSPFGPWDVNPLPIIEPTLSWAFNETIAPDVIIDNNTVRIWYMGNDEAFTQFAVGYAQTDWPLCRVVFNVARFILL